MQLTIIVNCELQSVFAVRDTRRMRAAAEIVIESKLTRAGQCTLDTRCTVDRRQIKLIENASAAGNK